MTVCKNCAKEFEGHYCPECGQKASTRRYSLRIALGEIVKKILPVDRGWLFTAVQLLTRPGPMLRDYLAGKRVVYTHPFQFMLLVSAISLLFFSREDFESGLQAGMQQTSPSEAGELMRKEFMDLFFTNFSAFLISVVPFLAFFSRLFYRKHEVNYAEHLVINCYLLAGSSIASMPSTLLFKILGINPFNMSSTLITTAIYLSYFVWGYLGFFRPENKILGGLKALLTYITAYLIFIFFIGLVVALGVFVYMALWGKPQ